MNRFSVRAACLLLAATACLAAPASAADLPLGTPLFIVNDVDTVGAGFNLDGIIGLTGNVVQLKDFAKFEDIPSWTFVATGLPGRVAIVKTEAAPSVKQWFVDAEPAAMPTDPDGVKLSPFTTIALVPASGQWRIIEPLVSGPFNIMNVQSGRLLEADTTSTTSTAPKVTKVQLKGRDGGSAGHRQWRFIPSRPTWTSPTPPPNPKNTATDSPAGARTLLRADLGLPAGLTVQPPSVPPTGEDFTNQVVDVRVDVTIIGNNSNQLKARVIMTVKSITTPGKEIKDTQEYPILTVAPGRRIFLNPDAGFAPSQMFTFKAGGPGAMATDKDWKLVSNFPNSEPAPIAADNSVGLITPPMVLPTIIPFVFLPLQTTIPSPQNDAAAATANTAAIFRRVISTCICVGDPSGTPMGSTIPPQPTGVLVHLEPIPVFVDVPATK
jgi:hypothetical protein